MRWNDIVPAHLADYFFSRAFARQLPVFCGVLALFAQVSLIKRLINGNESELVDSKRKMMEIGKAKAQKRWKIKLFHPKSR